MASSIDKHRYPWLTLEGKYLILLIAVVLIGGFLRFYDLGVLPIEGDDSYHLLAAKAILDSGKPAMPNGGLYLRSLPLLYLEALSLKTFGISEWSLRFPNAIIGTINILLVYFLAKTLSGQKKLAILTALFFSLSPWAIYVARKPRMYEAFLMAVLVSWILFHKWHYSKRGILIIPLMLASVAAVSLHQAAILPLVCFIIPLVIERRLRRDILISVACFAVLSAVWFSYNGFLLHLFH